MGDHMYTMFCFSWIRHNFAKEKDAVFCAVQTIYSCIKLMIIYTSDKQWPSFHRHRSWAMCRNFSCEEKKEAGRWQRDKRKLCIFGVLFYGCYAHFSCCYCCVLSPPTRKANILLCCVGLVYIYSQLIFSLCSSLEPNRIKCMRLIISPWQRCLKKVIFYGEE